MHARLLCCPLLLLLLLLLLAAAAAALAAQSPLAQHRHLTHLLISCHTSKQVMMRSSPRALPLLLLACFALLAGCASGVASAAALPPAADGLQCADEFAVRTRIASLCCPSVEYVLASNPRGSGPSCTQCAEGKEACTDAAGGCCQPGFSCVLDANHVPQCKSKWSEAVGHSGTDASRDVLPSATHAAPPALPASSSPILDERIAAVHKHWELLSAAAEHPRATLKWAALALGMPIVIMPVYAIIAIASLAASCGLFVALGLLVLRTCMYVYM